MNQRAAALGPSIAGSIDGSRPDVTGTLLACGILDGRIYVAVGLAEAALRPGLDLSRHSLSLLANGELGWIHMAMMVVSGLLTTAGALGLRRALTSGFGRIWGPTLIGLYGLGVAVAGLLTADPALGSRRGRLMARPQRSAGSSAGMGSDTTYSQKTTSGGFLGLGAASPSG